MLLLLSQTHTLNFTSAKAQYHITKEHQPTCQHSLLNVTTENLREIRMPCCPKYVQRLREHIIVDKAWINWKQAHQKDDIATSEDNAKYLQSVHNNDQILPLIH